MALKPAATHKVNLHEHVTCSAFPPCVSRDWRMRAGHVAHPPSPPTVYGLILRSFHKDLLDEYAYKLISDLMKSENTSSKDV